MGFQSWKDGERLEEFGIRVEDCATCHALVPEASYPDHEAWHRRRG
jgi:hypothetical protein